MLCFFVSCLVLSLRLARLFAHKGSGSHIHFCPRPCSSTCRWARLATHRHWGPLCVSRALVPTLAVQPPHVCHRQRDWAVSIGSHMQQDVDISPAPPQLGAPLPLRHGCRSLWLQRVFSAPPGASCTVVIKHDKGNASVQRTTFTHVTFHDGLLFVDQCGLP